MKQLYTIIAFLFLSLICAHAQQNSSSVKGTITDTVVGNPLAYATIKLMNKKDSSVYASAISDKQGSFQLNNIAVGDYVLQLTFQGYDMYWMPVNVPASSTVIDAGNIKLRPAAHELNTVTVHTSPMQLKGDTTEYNANMYSTKPNATAEDLIKKLPGVEVDASGNVKAQGETVQRVLVDGKRFFGDDAKIATQNLPSDIIDKIQVYDEQSDQSTFTGFDDGNRSKTINIVTKSSRRHGYFGKFTAGVGNDDLYNGGVSLNKFNGNEQISFLGQANNTNKQLFTLQDIFGSSNSSGGNNNRGGGGGNRGGGNGGPGGGGSQSFVRDVGGTNNNGITTTYSAGLNYRNDFSKKLSVSGSYFYNNLKVNTDQNSLTENFITGDSSQFYNKQLSSEKRNINQRINFNIETQFDSSNSLIVRPNFSIQNTSTASQTNTAVTQGKLTNLSNTTATTQQQNNGYNGNIQTTFRHKFLKKGRTISLNVELGGNNRDGNGNNFSVLNDLVNSSLDTTNQRYTIHTNGKSINSTLAYTEPIGKNQLLELNYNNTYNLNTSNRTTYDYDSVTHDFNKLNEDLTNVYRNTYNSNMGGLNYLFRTQQINFSAGTGIQYGRLTSENLSTKITLQQHYVNLYPTVNFNYKISRQQNLRFNYSGRTQQPSVTQLQPVRDESDPTNIKTGNPDLNQQFNNSFRVFYNLFNRERLRNIFAVLNATFTQNDIVNSITVLDDGTQITKPVNLNGSYNISGFFNYGFPLKKPKSNINLNTNFSNIKSLSLVNGVRNDNVNYTIGESLRWTTNLKEIADVNFSYTPTYNIAKYSLQPDENENYFTHNAMVEATFFTKSGWIVGSDFNLTAYTGRAEGYNTTIPLWNASLSKQFFKNKAGELKFSVNDILNQNRSVRRVVDENYIQDVSTKVLKRYFLVSFVYNLRAFKNQDKNPGMRSMPLPPGGPPEGMPPPPPPAGS